MGLVKVESRSVISGCEEVTERTNEPTFLDIGSSQLKTETLMCCLEYHMKSLGIPATDNNYEVRDSAVYYDGYVNITKDGLEVIDTTMLVYVDDEPVEEEELELMLRNIKPVKEIMTHVIEETI